MARSKGRRPFGGGRLTAPAMSKALRNGRSKGEGKHVRSYEWELASDAYRSLPCPARCLLIELKRLYDGKNNGILFLSVRRAAQLLGVNKDTAARAFHNLEERGFVRPIVKSGFTWKQGMATKWVLTEFEYAGELASKDFMRWRPGDKKAKHGPLTPDRLSPKAGQCPKNQDTFEAKCPLKPDTSPPIQGVHGPLNPDTYSLPSRTDDETGQQTVPPAPRAASAGVPPVPEGILTTAEDATTPVANADAMMVAGTDTQSIPLIYPSCSSLTPQQEKTKKSSEQGEAVRSEAQLARQGEIVIAHGLKRAKLLPWQLLQRIKIGLPKEIYDRVTRPGGDQDLMACAIAAEAETAGAGAAMILLALDDRFSSMMNGRHGEPFDLGDLGPWPSEPIPAVSDYFAGPADLGLAIANAGVRT